VLQAGGRARTFCRTKRRLVPELVPPQDKPPDIRPWLRERITWYDEQLGRIAGGAIVAPGEKERLQEEAELHQQLLELLERDATGSD
jgi:hypothetical protein